MRRLWFVVPVLVIALAGGAGMLRPAEVRGQSSYVWEGHELTLTFNNLTQLDTTRDDSARCALWDAEFPFYGVDAEIYAFCAQLYGSSHISFYELHFRTEEDAEEMKGIAAVFDSIQWSIADGSRLFFDSRFSALFANVEENTDNDQTATTNEDRFPDLTTYVLHLDPNDNFCARARTISWWWCRGNEVQGPGRR